MRRAHRAVGQRRLRDYRGKTMLAPGPRGEAKQVPRSEREAPPGDLSGHDAGQGCGAVQRGLPVGQLFPNPHDLPGLAAGLTDVPVVECEHAVPGGMEAGGAIVATAGVTRGALYHHFADKTALFEAVLAAVEADIARRLADEAAAAGLSDPVEILRYALRTWLDICVEPEILRIALIDGPSVLGWTHWREVCYLHVLGLVRVLLAQAIELGRIRRQPVLPLAHVLMGAGDEAALYVAEAADRAQARAEMIGVFDQIIESLTA
jgi:AcrR family transcriptional regulator